MDPAKKSKLIIGQCERQRAGLVSCRLSGGTVTATTGDTIYPAGRSTRASSWPARHGCAPHYYIYYYTVNEL